jgi:hypothetical protein
MCRNSLPSSLAHTVELRLPLGYVALLIMCPTWAAYSLVVLAVSTTNPLKVMVDLKLDDIQN